MKIHGKIIGIMGDLGAIGKDQVNAQQGFKFRGIDQFINAIHPLLVKHGLWIVPRCLSSTVEFKEVTRQNGSKGTNKHVSVSMEYNFIGEEDQVVIGPFPGEAIDSGDKATNKALSAAYKYMCIQTFCIQTEDIVDADSESPELEPASSPAKKAGPKDGNSASERFNRVGQDTNQHSSALVTEPQIKRLFAIANKFGWSSDKIKETMKLRYQVESTKELNKFNYDHLIGLIDGSSVKGG